MALLALSIRLTFAQKELTNIRMELLVDALREYLDVFKLIIVVRCPRFQKELRRSCYAFYKPHIF